MEFLGDSILDYLVITYLYTLDESWQPNRLNTGKERLVGNDALGKIACMTLEVHKYMYLDSIELGKQLEEFYKDMKAGYDKTDGLLSVPKALADVLEALVAAVYLDTSCDIEFVYEFFMEILLKNDRGQGSRQGGEGGEEVDLDLMDDNAVDWDMDEVEDGKSVDDDEDDELEEDVAEGVEESKGSKRKKLDRKLRTLRTMLYSNFPELKFLEKSL